MPPLFCVSYSPTCGLDWLELDPTVVDFWLSTQVPPMLERKVRGGAPGLIDRLLQGAL